MTKDIVEMGAEEAYRLVLHQVVRWLDGNVDPKKSRVFFVTASPTHASGQLWGDEAEGSNCHSQTKLIADTSYWGSTSRAMLWVTGEVLCASARVPVGVVNITQMSEYRRDAHMQVYREQWAPPTKEQLADPKSYGDCTHWCLPDVPDAWNELLYWKLFFPANERGAGNDMTKDIVEMGAEEAYRLVLHQVVRWLDDNVDPKKSRVFFVTASPTHASGQLWGDEAEGSNCHGQTKPIADASYWGSTSRAMLRVTGEVLGASARVPVGVVNVMQMSEYRRDTHTQVYREQWVPPTKEQLANPKSYADCTHWCLPGVPEAWNELLYWKLFFPANDQDL